MHVVVLRAAITVGFDGHAQYTTITVVIEPLSAIRADDIALMADVADLINVVYEESERGLWHENAARTNLDEVIALTRAEELVIAREDARLTGVVCVQRLDHDTGEFGMLAADPARRGRGIGRDLVRYAEDAIRASGRHYMQLELLVPQGWTLASKEFLQAWYGRLGYELQRVTQIEESYPDLAPLLCTPADFRIYRKRL
jgi:GNAT superfamily N-acetyltransferase